jgi:hypothetical protein
MNSIRTPKEGTTVSSKRIAQAVDNEDWQKFRVALKGITTRMKLRMLEEYNDTEPHTGRHEENDCDTCIRVDNYIKALCRGGQLEAGESLDSAIKAEWKLRVLK